MKTLSFLLLLMANLAFVLAGCTDTPGPVAASASGIDNPAALLAKTSGPGAWIYRGTYDTYRYGFLDANSGLAALVGVNDFSTFCVSFEDGIDEFPFKDLLLPDADPDLRRVMEQVKGTDVSISVWDLDVFQGGFCATGRAGYRPIAVGTVHYINTDNDLLAWLQLNYNMNAYGCMAEGSATGPEGQAYRVTIVYRAIYSAVTQGYREVMKIRLIPVSGR